MSETNKAASFDVRKEFSTQDAEDIVKDVLGKDAFERSDDEDLEIAEKKQKSVEALPKDLRTIWWQIENENAQSESQKNRIRERLKSASNLSNREKRRLNEEIDHLNHYRYLSEKVQEIIAQERTKDKALKSLNDLIKKNESLKSKKNLSKEIGDDLSNGDFHKDLLEIKTDLEILNNLKNRITKINNFDKLNFMPESTSKELSPIISVQKNESGEDVGMIADNDLARDMADREDGIFKEYKDKFKIETNKEVVDSAEVAMNRAAEAVFKEATGMEYEAAAQKARENLNNEQAEIDKEVENNGEKVKNQANGIANEEIKRDIIDGADKAAEDLKNIAGDSKKDAEEKINEIEMEVPKPEPKQEEAKEIKDEKIEAAKKDLENKIKNIDGKIKILENSHGNPGDRRMYIAREAGIDMKQLTPKEEERQRRIILARRKAEKSGLQKVEEIANSPEIKNYDELQDRLWDNYKSAKVEFGKKCDELDKEPKDSDRRKKLIEEKRDLQARMQMAKDSVADFDNRSAKEREEKDKKRQMRNQKAVKSVPVGKPQEPKAVEPKIDAKPADVQPDSQPKQGGREEMADAYDQRIANLRLGVNEAKESGNMDEAARLEKFAREVENEKKWRIRNADGKDQGKGENKYIKPQVQNKDAQVIKDKIAEPKNYDQEWQSLREQIKQAENEGKGEEVKRLEQEIYKLEQKKRDEKALAQEGKNEARKKGQIAKIEQRIVNLRLEITEAEKAGNENEVLKLEDALRDAQKEKSRMERKGSDKGLKDKIIKDSPEIALPEDEKKKSQLENKLEEYKSRIDRYKAPELQMSTICKIAVLERLLKDGKINKQELAREMSNRFGSGFSGKAFDNACGVIEDYCRTGGKNIKGGTGLGSAEGEPSPSSKNPTELESDEAETKHKTNGPVYGNESLSDDMRENAEKIKNGKKVEGKQEEPASAEAMASKEKTAEETIEKGPEYKGGYPAVIEAAPKVELTNEQTARVERILKDFDLTAEDAEKIEGFKDLSYGQRLLALQNLRQLTLRDVRIGAVETQKEEAAQTQGFWKRMWKGIKKRYDIAKHEKSIANDLNKEDYAATLAQLARGMRELKTDVVEKNGQLEFQYVSGLENLTPEQAARVQRFNEVASELSKLPMEWTADSSKKGFFRQMMDKAGLGQAWSPDDPTRSQHRQTGELNAEFQSLKQEVVRIIKQQKDSDLKKAGVEKFDDLETQSHATAQMLQIENLLRYNRAMNINPDAEKALLEIKSAPLWKRALNNIATEKGIYFVAGFAARSVSVSLLGTAGIIGGAAGMGGYMGYKRGKETLRENDALAQHKDFEETKKKRIEKFERAKQGKAGPTGEAEKTEKRIEDANVLARNLNNFVEYIKEEDDPKRRMDLSRRLRDRVKFVKDALDQGRINFGGTGERAANLYELTDKLNDAVNCVEIYHPSTRHEVDQWSEANQSEVMEKLNQYLAESKIELDAERRKYLVKQLAKGAMYGAGFASAGMIARELFSHLDPHLFNAQGETDLGVRWISGSGSGKPLVGGIVGKYMHGEPGGGGAGYESGKGPEMFPGEKYFGQEANSGKAKDLVARFYEESRYNPEWKNSLLEQGKALQDLTRQLEEAGIKDPDTLKEIIDSAKDQLNGDGKIFIGGSQEAQNLAGIESTGGSGGGSTAEQTATAAGAEKSVDAVVGAKTEATQFINEIKNVGGIKHDSIWRSTHDLIQSKAKELGLEYPGAGKTKLTETDWYNAKTSQLVNELDKSTQGGIKDLVHEGDKIILAKGGDGKLHLILEESSGIKSGRLADLHHHVAGAKAPVIEGNISTEVTQTPHSVVVEESTLDVGEKIKDLEKSGVSGDDLEKLTVKDIKDLTENQIAQIKDYTAKAEALKKIGISEDDINSLTEKDIRDLTPEQIKNLALDKAASPQEPAQKIEIDKDFFKEETSAGAKNPTIEQVAKIETPNNIKIVTDKFSGDIKFKYDANGNPTELLPIDHEELRRITGSEYFDKSSLKSLDYLTKADGKDLVARVEIFKELNSNKDFKLADVVLGDIKKIATQLDARHNSIIDYSKLPQEIREKLGK